MTLKQHDEMIQKIEALTPNVWYNIPEDHKKRKHLIEVLKCLIRWGKNYVIRGEWTAFMLDMPLLLCWQQVTPLPEGITLHYVAHDDDTSFDLPNGRRYVCTGPAHVIVKRNGRTIAIEEPIKKK